MLHVLVDTHIKCGSSIMLCAISESFRLITTVTMTVDTDHVCVCMCESERAVGCIYIYSILSFPCILMLKTIFASQH